MTYERLGNAGPGVPTEVSGCASRDSSAMVISGHSVYTVLIVFSGLCCLLSDSAAQTRCTRCTARLRLANAVPRDAVTAAWTGRRVAELACRVTRRTTLHGTTLSTVHGRVGGVVSLVSCQCHV